MSSGISTGALARAAGRGADEPRSLGCRTGDLPAERGSDRRCDCGGAAVRAWSYEAQLVECRAVSERVLRDLHQSKLEITPLHRFCIVAHAAVSIRLLLFAGSGSRAGVTASGVMRQPALGELRGRIHARPVVDADDP